ncbi:MAG TPA: hypothetical protein VMX12_05220 [Acidimicrobiia bacterium]|nr:hypothetical protein [Acidimicrobiia bacterium]
MAVRGNLHQTFTRHTQRDSGEVVREFDLRSAAAVLAAFMGAIFLVFYLLAFLPWLLSNGMTAAVEGMMHQVGFGDFRANTLGDWILVLFIGAVFTMFIVALVLAILKLYNVLSHSTGLGFSFAGEIEGGDAPRQIEAAAAKKARPTKKSAASRSSAKPSGAKRSAKKRPAAKASARSTKRAR